MQTRSTYAGAEDKETLNTNVVGKTPGNDDSKFRCVAKIGFQKRKLVPKGKETIEGKTTTTNI